MTNIRGLIQILKLFTDLADVYRHNTMPFNADRKENVAEHSYILGSLGCAVAEHLNQTLEKPLNLGSIAQFALVHDLAEARMENGDISVYASDAIKGHKQTDEATAFQKITEEAGTYSWVVDTIQKYEARTTAEARFVYALDKIIVHLYVIAADTHHAKPTMAQYLQTETVATQKIAGSFPALLPLFQELCDQFKSRPHLFADK